MTIKLAYQVNSTSEFGIAGLYDLKDEPRFFATREQAVAYAQQLTGVTESNGSFEGEWESYPALFLAAMGPDMERKRTVATVETVTLEEIEASL